jgi:tetratricopeptide (TPR) repeat protein
MLRSFADKRPDDPFPRYGLAMELKSTGDGEGAWQVFASLIAAHPTYIAAYAPAAEVLVALGRTDEARSLYGRGIEACGKVGDAHAREHLASAMAGLDGE